MHGTHHSLKCASGVVARTTLQLIVTPRSVSIAKRGVIEFSEDPLSADSHKCPPSSPAKDDPATKKALHIARQPTASAVHPLQPSDDNSPCESSFLKTFLRAIKKPSPE